MNQRLLLYGGSAAMILGFLFRKKIAKVGTMAVDAARASVFRAVLPARAARFADVILKVAGEENIDPFMIVALGERESRWGDALRADATGDCTARDGRMPSDGMCWGRGLMQIDLGSFSDWLATNNWRDPYVNIRKGAQVLKAKMRVLSSTMAISGLTDGKVVTVGPKAAERRRVSAGKYPDRRPLSGTQLITASIAAYNQGEGNTIISLAVGSPLDSVTTGGDYSSDVVALASNLANRFLAATGGATT